MRETETPALRKIHLREVHIMKNKVFCVVFVAILFFALSSTGRAQEVIKLKNSIFFPSVHFQVALMDQFAKDLKERTKGRVEMTNYPGGTLVPPDKAFSGAIEGISDLALFATGLNPGRFPVSEILEVPLGYPSAYVASHVIDDVSKKFKMKEYDNVHLIWLWSCPPSIFTSVNKPIKSLEDIKNMRIRGIGRTNEVVKALGAAAIPLPSSDTYEAMRKGILDGMYTPMETSKGYKYADIIRYATASYKISVAGTFSLVMNKEKYNSLPADIKKIFDDLCTEYFNKQLPMWNQQDIDGREFFKSKGGTLSYLTDAESKRWIKAVEPVIEEYKKYLVSKGLTQKEVDDIIQFAKERIPYWIKMEKQQKIPTAYEY
jgi:TRAP-type C4-dicarboxylate transport system substrate-binding protein